MFLGTELSHIYIIDIFIVLCCREETNKEEDEALFEEELAEELQERR